MGISDPEKNPEHREMHRKWDGYCEKRDKLSEEVQGQERCPSCKELMDNVGYRYSSPNFVCNACEAEFCTPLYPEWWNDFNDQPMPEDPHPMPDADLHRGYGCGTMPTR